MLSAFNISLSSVLLFAFTAIIAPSVFTAKVFIREVIMVKAPSKKNGLVDNKEKIRVRAYILAKNDNYSKPPCHYWHRAKKELGLS